MTADPNAFETAIARSKIVVTGVIDPPSLILSLIDPVQTVTPATGDPNAPGTIWNIPGAVHSHIPLEEVDGFIKMVEKKRDQIRQAQ